MKPICASCMKKKDAAATCLFIPYDGGKPVIYHLCELCIAEKFMGREHAEAVIEAIERNLGV